VTTDENRLLDTVFVSVLEDRPCSAEIDPVPLLRSGRHVADRRHVNQSVGAPRPKNILRGAFADIRREDFDIIRCIRPGATVDTEYLVSLVDEPLSDEPADLTRNAGNQDFHLQLLLVRLPTGNLALAMFTSPRDQFIDPIFYLLDVTFDGLVSLRPIPVEMHRFPDMKLTVDR